MARLIPENSSSHAASNNAELFGTRGALNQLPVGMMILSALIALPLTSADSQMLDCIVPTGFFTRKRISTLSELLAGASGLRLYDCKLQQSRISRSEIRLLENFSLVGTSLEPFVFTVFPDHQHTKN